MRPARRRSVAVLVLAGAVAAFPLGTLASHDFADVPNTNPFHNDISALADSGVTFGCGGGNYCPSAFVTREQMAAFLNRLGALAPGKVPVVNADRLDGYQGIDLALGTATIPSGTTVTGLGGWDYATIADNATVEVTVQLPGRTPVALTAATVNFAPDAVTNDEDASCTGTATAPSAPAGKVCVYIISSSNVDGAAAYAPYANFANRYFAITFATSGPGAGNHMYLWYSWAYTAP